MDKFFLIILSVLVSVNITFGNIEFVILHNNDMHARFEETAQNSGTCKPEDRGKNCFGGFARIAHVVRQFNNTLSDVNGKELLFLNAGDTYTGTNWFTLFNYSITIEFVNALKFDVMCLGNHEFDNTPDGLAPFVNQVNCPVISANLNFSFEPILSKVQKSVILERSGRKIGVIGYLTPETISIASPRNTIFYDEVQSVTTESERLNAMGVNIILALGHSGYLMDQRIAAEVPLVDAVIGGHTNTFLWNGKQPDTEAIEDLYPKVITQRSGKKVPVVQAYAYTKYLGVLNLTFDDKGDLLEFVGQPILLESSIPQEQDVLDLLEKYRPEIDKMNTLVIGKSKVILDGRDIQCRYRECNFGNLVADAYALYKHSVSPSNWVPIGLQNGGGIRTSIEPGDNGEITYGEILGALPFSNQIISQKMNGSDIVKTIEIGARSQGETSRGEFLQVSGLKVVLDMSKPPYNRVVSVKVKCGNCSKERYDDIVLNHNYTIVTSSFLAVQGGDSHHILANNGFDKVTEDLSDVDVINWYFKEYSPVEPKLEGRIILVGDSASGLQSSSLMLILLVPVLFNVVV